MIFECYVKVHKYADIVNDTTMINWCQEWHQIYDDKRQFANRTTELYKHIKNRTTRIPVI